MENQGFLNRPAVEDIASEVKDSEFSERGMKKLRLQASPQRRPPGSGIIILFVCIGESDNDTYFTRV